MFVMVIKLRVVFLQTEREQFQDMRRINANLTQMLMSPGLGGRREFLVSVRITLKPPFEMFKFCLKDILSTYRNFLCRKSGKRFMELKWRLRRTALYNARMSTIATIMQIVICIPK